MKSPRGMRPTVVTDRRSQSAHSMTYASQSPPSPTSPRSSQDEDDDTVNSGGSGGGWLGMVKDTLFGDDEYSEDGSYYSEVEESTADHSLGPYYYFGGAPATMKPKGTETKTIHKPRSSNTWAPAPIISPPHSPVVRKAESVGFKLHNRQLTFPNRKTFPRLVVPAAANTKIGSSQTPVREKKADPKKIDIKMERNAEPKKTDLQLKFPITQITSPPDSKVEKAIITNKYAPPRPKPALRNTTPSPDVDFGQQPGQNHRVPPRYRRPSRLPANIFNRTPHSDITWDVTTASGDISMSATATEASSLHYLSPYFKHNYPSPGLQKKPEPLKVKRSSTFNIGSSEKKQIYRPPGFPKERWSPLKKDEPKDAAVKIPPRPVKSKSKIPGPSSKHKQQEEEENEIVFNDAGSDIENELEDRLWDNHQLWNGLSYRMIESPSLEEDNDRIVERWTPGDVKALPTSRSDMHDDSSVGKSLERERKSLKSFYVSQLSVDLACTEDPAIKTDPPASITQASPLSIRERSSPNTSDPIESPSTFEAIEKNVAFGWTAKSPISRVSECTRETSSTIAEKSVVSSRSKVDKTPTNANLLHDLLKDCGPRKDIFRVSTSHAAAERSDDFLRFDEDKLKAIIAEDDISKNNPRRVRSSTWQSVQAKTPGGESNAPLPPRDCNPTFGSASRLRAKRAARKKEECEKDEEPYNMMATVKYGVSRNGTLKSPVLKRSNRSEPSPTRPYTGRVSLEMESADQGAGVFHIASVSPAVGREMEPENANTTEIGVESVLRTYDDKGGSPVGPDFLILDPLINLSGPECDDGSKERRMIISPFKRFRNSPAERPRIDPVKLHADSSSTMELVAAEARKQKYVNPFPRILESPMPGTRKGEAVLDRTKTDLSAGRSTPPIRRVEVEDTASSFQNEGIEVNRVSTPTSESRAPPSKPTPIGAFRRLTKVGLNSAFLPRPQRKPLAVETIRNDQEEFSHQGFEVEPVSPRTLGSIDDTSHTGQEAQTPAGPARDAQKQARSKDEEHGADTSINELQARSQHHPARKSPTQIPSPETKMDVNAMNLKDSDCPPLNAGMNTMTQFEAHGIILKDYLAHMESPVDRRKLKREAHLAKLVATTANGHSTETNDLKCAPPPRLDEKAVMAKQIVSRMLSKEEKHFSPQASVLMDGCFENQCKFEPQRVEQSLALLDFKPWHKRLLRDSSIKVPQLEAKNSTATAEDIIEDLDAASSIRKSRSSTTADKDGKTPTRVSSKDIVQDANDEAEKKALSKESQNSKHGEAKAQEGNIQMISEKTETVVKYNRKMPNKVLNLKSTDSTETPKLTMKKKLKNLFKRKKKTTVDLHPTDSSYHHLLAESSAETITESKSLLRTMVVSATAVASPVPIQRKDTKDTSSAVTASKLSKGSSVQAASKNQDEGIRKRAESDMKQPEHSRSVANISHVEKKPEIATQTEVLESPGESKESKKNANRRNKIPKRLPLNKKYSSQSCASSVDNSLDKLMEDDDDELLSKGTISTDLSSSTNPSYSRVKLGEDGSTSRSKESSRLDKAENKVAKRLARDLRLLTRIERRRRELTRKPQAESFAESIEVLDTLEKLVKRRAMIAAEEEGGSLLDHNISATNDGWFGNLSHKVADMFACAAPPCRPS